MGHIVFATPSIGRFYLHHRLRRDLQRRGHRVSMLCSEQSQFTFWRDQVSGADLLTPTRGDEDPSAMRAFLEQRQPDDELHRLAPAILRWFEREQPDLVIFHQERSATAQCLQFAARTVGAKVLWTGDGLLPHTMQVDERGLDADSSFRRWQPRDYRVVKSDPSLLNASLTHALADAEPLALPRAEIQVPPIGRRLADALSCLTQGRWRAAKTAMNGWRAAFEPDQRPAQPAPRINFPPPFVAVLLQEPNDARIVHDAANAPDAQTLIARAITAADRIAPNTLVIAVAPDRFGQTPTALTAYGGQHMDRVHTAPAKAAAILAATAATTITINHPTASVALLAGTPVVHLGRALYELPGVTTHTVLDDLPEAVARAQQHNRPALRRRFLTWLFRHGHVWCSPTAPNHNGMLGLVQAVEQRLSGDAIMNSRPLPYRPGPTWPLAMQ